MLIPRHVPSSAFIEKGGAAFVPARMGPDVPSAPSAHAVPDRPNEATTNRMARRRRRFMDPLYGRSPAPGGRIQPMHGDDPDLDSEAVAA